MGREIPVELQRGAANHISTGQPWNNNNGYHYTFTGPPWNNINGYHYFNWHTQNNSMDYHNTFSFTALRCNNNIDHHNTVTCLPRRNNYKGYHCN